MLGIVNTMNFGARNAGFREVEGFDFDVLYSFENRFGEFTFSLMSVYLTKDDENTTNDPNAIPDQNIGFASSAGTTHRVRANGNLSWTRGNFGVTWGARYYSGLKETCLNADFFQEECSDPDFVGPTPQQTRPVNRTGSNTFHDLQVRWEAPWDATLSIGANNVFDHVGPQMYSQPNANVAYNGEFDIGRFAYLRYRQDFDF